MFNKLNEVPSDKDEYLAFKTKSPITYHEQVIPVSDNGTMYIGIKPSKIYSKIKFNMNINL